VKRIIAKNDKDILFQVFLLFTPLFACYCDDLLLFRSKMQQNENNTIIIVNKMPQLFQILLYRANLPLSRVARS